MAAPGLAMIAASPRAWAAMETPRCRASTSTCARTASAAAGGQTPFTPAIAVVFQVDEGLRLMQAEGAEAIFARHEACAAASRAGLAALGFELFADERHYSRTVTAAKRARRPRLEGVQRRRSRPRPRAGRRPGQAHRQDLPPRSPRLGDVEEILGAIAHARERSRSSTAVRSSRARRSRPPSVPRSRRTGIAAACRPPGPAREGPRRRGRRARGHRSPRARTTRSTNASAAPATSSCAILPEYDALIVRSQVQVDAELIAAGAPAASSSAGPGSASTTSTSMPRRAAGITVVNAPTGNTIAAAEHTLALLYGVARRTAAADASAAPRRVEARRSSPAWSCAAGRSGSSGSARSARRSRSGRARWR